LSTSLFKVV